MAKTLADVKDVFERLKDYFLRIRGYHKHAFRFLGYKTIEVNRTFEYPVWICRECGKRLHLEEEQIRNLPFEMQYSKSRKVVEG